MAFGMFSASHSELRTGIISSCTPFTTSVGWLTRCRSAKRAAGELLPFAKRGQLSTGNVRSRRWVAIFGALSQPADKHVAGQLARLCWSKENLLHDRVALKASIAEVARENGFFQVHDVLATAGCRADEDHAAETGWSVERDLLRDHAAQGESEHIATLETDAIQERHSVLRHAGDGLRDRAGRTTDTGIVEEDDFSPGCEGVGHRRSQLSSVPVKCCRHRSGRPGPAPNRRKAYVSDPTLTNWVAAVT